MYFVYFNAQSMVKVSKSPIWFMLFFFSYVSDNYMRYCISYTLTVKTYTKPLLTWRPTCISVSNALIFLKNIIPNSKFSVVYIQRYISSRSSLSQSTLFRHTVHKVILKIHMSNLTLLSIQNYNLILIIILKKVLVTYYFSVGTMLC